MKLILLTEDWFNSYESFLINHPSAMVYYSIKFKYFLEKQTESISKYLIALDDNGNIKGILPLLIKDGPLGLVVNSLPFYGSNGGILAENDEAKHFLLAAYIQFIHENEIAAATLIENPLDKSYPYDKLKWDELDYRIGQLTDISGNYSSLEDLMVKFDSKTRNIIRKAIKSKVKIEIDNTQIDFLERTHVDNMSSIGGLAKESNFFENLRSVFEGGSDYNIYIAKLDGELIAAMLVFYFGKVVEYYTPVIVKQYRSFQPLSLIITTAMLDANEMEFKWWNWGGTWQSQGGVYEFKSKWGTIDINYNYYTIINNKAIYRASREDLLKYYKGFFVISFTRLETD